MAKITAAFTITNKKFIGGETMKKICAGILCIIMLMSLLTACSGAPAPENGAAEPAPAEVKATQSDQIVIARPVDCINMDPVMTGESYDIWVFDLSLEGLTKTSDDGKSIEPCLADSWDISEDGLTYTFHLKEGLKFSDGTPVTGEDWVWSIKRARDTKESPWTGSAAAIKDVAAPDDKTLVITLSEPSAPFLSNLAMFNLRVQSKAHFDKVGEKGYVEGAIGTGPYMLSEWKKGEYMLLTKNPHYRNKDLPKTEKVKFVVVSDDDSRIMQLQAKEVDIILDIPFSSMANLDAMDGISAYGYESTQAKYLVLNTLNKKLSDVRVRQALRYATDTQQMVDLICYGYGEKAVSYMPKNGLYWNDQIKPAEYDPEKAKALLAEAGYPQGFELEFLVRSGNAVYEQIATIIKEQWSKVGIDVKLTTLETASLLAIQKKMEHEICIGSWSDDVNDPSQLNDYIWNYDSSMCFYTGYKNDEAEALNKAANKELDENARKDAYFKLQEIEYEDVPLMSLYYSDFTVAMLDSVKGFVRTPLGNYRLENTVKIGN